MSTTVYVTFSPAPVNNFGSILSKGMFSESMYSVVEVETEMPDDAMPTDIVDLYFTPSVAIFNQSYVEI